MSLSFVIGLHIKDRVLLERIKEYFNGVGTIPLKGEAIHYTVNKIKDIAKIIEHFDKYPLITQKLADYLLFKQVFDLMCINAHLTLEGLQKVVACQATLDPTPPKKKKDPLKLGLLC